MAFRTLQSTFPARACWLLFVMATVVPGTISFAQGPKEKAAIRRGVSYLRTALGKREAPDSTGQSVLAAYAMLNGGAKPSDPAVSGVLTSLKKRLVDGKYVPSSHNIYAAGCELMLLEAAETHPGEHRAQMQLIVDFIVKNQHADGYWNYLGGDKGGDTSVTQYGVLGLWAAKRRGIDVPLESFERAARWLMAHQKSNGTWQYRPLVQRAPDLSMTIAGTSTVLVAQRYLYPGQSGRRTTKTPARKQGVVQRVDIDTPVSKAKSRKKKAGGDYKPEIPFARYSAASRAGLKWCAGNFRFAGEWTFYTLYGMERMAALARLRTIGGHDWYAEGSDWLLKNQGKDGSWSARREGVLPGTSFAILFLGRTTSKLLGEVPPDLLGDGLLRGGHGLPADLSTIEEGQGGAIKKRTSLGPIDDLLLELQKPEKLDVPEVQKAIVEKIQLGDRKQWLQPARRKQLLRMVNHKNPEVRKVAVWALGRTGNIDVAAILMDALESDPDVDVAVEARNALCWLARKPNGFGSPETPKYPAGATKAQRRRAADDWRSAAVQRWKKWYLQVRPYRERDDLKETGVPAKANG